jgi:hypothetical protein
MFRPLLAADGRTVVFHSMASDLVSGDFNDKRDLFKLKLGGDDTDGDGLDDDWEVAYFSNLARDGTGDIDGDGADDGAEFLAGTDPTNAGSVFRVITLTALGSGVTRVLWAGSPGRGYRVEFKEGTEGSWAVLPGAISWEGSTGSITDSNAATGVRFYRAVRLP